MKLKKYGVFFMFLGSIQALYAADRSVVTVFAPGFTAVQGISAKYTSAFPVESKIEEITSFPDQQAPVGCFNRLVSKSASFWGKNGVNRGSWMGQGEDIDAVAKHVRPESPVLLYGLCKSGSALINYLAENNPENVQALVLEGACADLLDVVHAKIAPMGISKSYCEMVWRLCFPNYPKNTVPPIDMIKKIKNKDLPILILHSKEDKTVPFSQALRLYQEFKDQGFTHVHLEVLKGLHCAGIRDDNEKYLTAVHSFYKSYGFEDTSQYATKNISDYMYDTAQAQSEIYKYNESLKFATIRSQQKLLKRSIIVGSIACSVVSAWYVGLLK